MPLFHNIPNPLNESASDISQSIRHQSLGGIGLAEDTHDLSNQRITVGNAQDNSLSNHSNPLNNLLIYSDRDRTQHQPIKVKNMEFNNKNSLSILAREKSACILEKEPSNIDNSPMKRTFENEILLNNPDFQMAYDNIISQGLRPLQVDELGPAVKKFKITF